VAINNHEFHWAEGGTERPEFSLGSRGPLAPPWNRPCIKSVRYSTVTGFNVVITPPTRTYVIIAVCLSVRRHVHSVCLSLCQQDYCKSSHPISLKLGVMTGLSVATRSSAIADKPRDASLTNRAMLVCKVVEVCMQGFLSEYIDKKFTYICYRRLIRHE